MNDPANTVYPADNPATLAHITILQSIINRLAGSSASCKTWCLTLSGALLSLAAAAHASNLAETSIIPVIFFGFLDTMYLGQERAYRDLYNRIVVRIHKGDYCRDDVFASSANFTFSHWLRGICSWSIWPFYLSLIVLYFTGLFTGSLAQLAVVVK